MNIPFKAGARLKAALVGAAVAASAVACGGGGDPAGLPGQPMAASQSMAERQSMATTQVSGTTQAPSMPADGPTPGR